jgi:hypothetical protein
MKQHIYISPPRSSASHMTITKYCLKELFIEGISVLFSYAQHTLERLTYFIEKKQNLIADVNRMMSCFNTHPANLFSFLPLEHNFLLCKQQLQIDLSYRSDLNVCVYCEKGLFDFGV